MVDSSHKDNIKLVQTDHHQTSRMFRWYTWLPSVLRFKYSNPFSLSSAWKKAVHIHSQLGDSFINQKATGSFLACQLATKQPRSSLGPAGARRNDARGWNSLPNVEHLHRSAATLLSQTSGFMEFSPLSTRRFFAVKIPPKRSMNSVFKITLIINLPYSGFSYSQVKIRVFLK